MQKAVFNAFDRVCSNRKVGDAILEVGCMPSDDTLLFLNALEGARRKVGINIDGPYSYRGIEIFRGNGNSMECFDTGEFDTVVCNATLEHDKYFWKTVSEIRRVTKSGGHVIIGTPGFVYYKVEIIKRIIRKLPFIKYALRMGWFDFPLKTTITFEVHNAPRDYYRFSPQAYEDVIMEGLRNVEIVTVSKPPRIIGAGETK